MMCQAIVSMLDEVENVQKSDLESSALQAEIALGVQRIKQYQLAGYRAVQSYATALGHSQHLQVLESWIADDEKAGQKLSKLRDAAVRP